MPTAVSGGCTWSTWTVRRRRIRSTWRDGMLSGPSTSLYTKLQAVFPEIDITVSGGIGSWSDIEELDRLGLRSVIVGKAIYEGRISFDQLRVTAR